MELQFILNHFTLIVAVVCAMCVMVSVITEFTKEFGFLNVIPTKLQVLVTSLIVCIIAFMMYMSYMKLQIFWYYIPAITFVAIIVAIITTNGWDYFFGIVNRFFIKDLFDNKTNSKKGVVNTMAIMAGHADKRTEEQRKNDVAQNVKPKGAQDKHYVTTGPATGKEDERAVDTE